MVHKTVLLVRYQLWPWWCTIHCCLSHCVCGFVRATLCTTKVCVRCEPLKCYAMCPLCTMVHNIGRWPRPMVTGKNGSRKVAVLLRKSVYFSAPSYFAKRTHSRDADHQKRLISGFAFGKSNTSWRLIFPDQNSLNFPKRLRLKGQFGTRIKGHRKVLGTKRSKVKTRGQQLDYQSNWRSRSNHIPVQPFWALPELECHKSYMNVRQKK